MVYEITISCLSADELDPHCAKLEAEAKRLFDWCSHLHTYIQTIGNTARSLADDHLRATNWNCQHQVLLIIERQMLALHDSAVERAEELKASSEKLTKLVPLVSKFCQWVRRVNELMLVVCTSIKQLGAIDQRATAFSTLMSAKVDNEQRQGIFVSISTARLEYFNKLVVSLVYTMGNQEEFDRWFDLLKRLIALELGEVENVTEKEVDEKRELTMFRIKWTELSLPKWALIEDLEVLEKA